MDNEKDKDLDPASGSSRTPGDWIKDLFAPIYDFDAVVEIGKHGYKAEESKIKRVPILDPVAIREVFERVHQRIIDNEREEEELVKEATQKELDKRIDPRESSIWNTEELDVLRKVYKSAKAEITKLEVALREEKQYSSRLEKKALRQEHEIEVLRAKLAEATKSNQRLVIHRNSLQKDLAVLEVKVSALTDMWHEIEAEKVKAFEESKSAHIDLDKERILRQNLELKLMESDQNLACQKALVEKNMSAKYEMEIADLKEVMQDLTMELQAEKKLHEASRRGLDHLRNHFSSLPLRNILPPNAVVKDEVDYISHCS
ncbi:myosin-9-like [Biomphalaria glabrata]|uniref:Myosin-9-like n=1 Tax=Biomphalaria glabrata TaxID=6526 RepID=A0A9W2Z1S7_BIOGL|nr:myosin-9-like [Biomphalaria glabrata]KAI8743615.1 myosin-9 [Biomphalaria glabrata]